MAIVCPACGTENRSIAKFCIECIAPLPAVRTAPKPATAPAPLPDDMPSALVAFASPGPPSPLMPPMQLPHAPAARRGIGVGLASLFLLVAAALAWLLIGSGLWQGGDKLGSSPVQAASASDVPHRQVAGEVEQPPPPVPLPVAAAPAEPPPTAAEALAPGESIVAARARAAPSGPAQPAIVPPPLAATKAPALPAPRPEQPAAPPAARPEPAAALFARCEALSYIAASRCRVDLCDQAANRHRKECQPVLAQQRMLEEKRNPTMAN